MRIYTASTIGSQQYYPTCGRSQIVSNIITLFVAGPSRNGCERCHCRPRRNSVWTAFRLDRSRRSGITMSRATSSPPPLAGEGQGGGTRYERAFSITLSPTLPRKRGREQTESVARWFRLHE